MIQYSITDEVPTGATFCDEKRFDELKPEGYKLLDILDSLKRADANAPIPDSLALSIMDWLQELAQIACQTELSSRRRKLYEALLTRHASPVTLTARDVLNQLERHMDDTGAFVQRASHLARMFSSPLIDAIQPSLAG